MKARDRALPMPGIAGRALGGRARGIRAEILEARRAGIQESRPMNYGVGRLGNRSITAGSLRTASRR